MKEKKDKESYFTAQAWVVWAVGRPRVSTRAASVSDPPLIGMIGATLIEQLSPCLKAIKIVSFETCCTEKFKPLVIRSVQPKTNMKV